MKIKVENLILKNSKKFNKIKEAIKTSSIDINKSLEELVTSPSTVNALNLLKTVSTSCSWISFTYLRFLAHLFKVKKEFDFEKKRMPLRKEIIEDIQSKHQNDYPNYLIFSSIYDELLHYYKNPLADKKISIKKTNVKLILIPGVFNEIFSTPSFERAAKYLFEKRGIEYSVVNVSGVRGSRSNKNTIRDELEKIVNASGKKLWVLGFSKGGVDFLHFLKNNPDFAKENIIGFSAVASPILGSGHPHHFLFKTSEFLSKQSWFQKILSKEDFLWPELQESLKGEIRRSWFFRNHKSLPKELFYTSVAFKSKWYKSHIWMILAKLVFQSKKENDGVVDIENAHFPDYFESFNLGEIDGHHLVGNRSSYFEQEVLLESLILFLQYKGRI